MRNTGKNQQLRSYVQAHKREDESTFMNVVTFIFKLGGSYFSNFPLIDAITLKTDMNFYFQC